MINKFFSLAFFCLLLLGSSLKAQYCETKAADKDFEYISEVQLNEIVNESGSDLYTDYTAALSTVLYIGERYEFRIITEQLSPTDKLACWIDWNQNQVFDNNEQIELNFTGEFSKQGIGTATLVLPAEAMSGETRMRILLADSEENLSPCMSFTYGEVEDYLVDIKKIESAPEVDFTADVRSVFVQDKVHFTDLSLLAPTEWTWEITPASVTFEEGTTAESRNPVISFDASGKYTIKLKATNEIGSSELIKEEYIDVKNYSAPKNVAVETEGNHAVINWLAPNLPSWQTYIEGTLDALLWTGPERATLFDDASLNFTYPVTISKLNHVFYYHNDHPWPNDQFRFKIYNVSDNKLIYESKELTAKHQTPVTCELDSAVTLMEDFFVAVVPSDASGLPSSLALGKKPGEGNTYSWDVETKNWVRLEDEETAYELSTSIFISHDADIENTEIKSNVHEFKSKLDRSKVQELREIIPTVQNTKLSGYEVYRNDEKIASIESAKTRSYRDEDIADGTYVYGVKAVYTPSGISPLSLADEVSVDNSGPEFKKS